MKKAILLLLILCNVLSAYAKDYSSKVFKDCFDKSDESYEFNIRNPFFVEKFYVKDLKKLKNKIIKETIESYYVDEQGRKSYEIVQKDFVRNKEKTFHGEIENKDHGLLLTFNQVYDGSNEIEFSMNKILKRRVYKKDDFTIKEILISNNSIQNKQYNLKNNVESYWGITNCQNCYQINQKRFVPSGDEFYEYTLDSNGRGIYTYFKEGKTPEKEIKQEVYRRFNPIGFLEYEEKKPYKTEVGNLKKI